jgi:hypothetical protein
MEPGVRGPTHPRSVYDILPVRGSLTYDETIDIFADTIIDVIGADKRIDDYIEEHDKRIPQNMDRQIPFGPIYFLQPHILHDKINNIITFYKEDYDRVVEGISSNIKQKVGEGYISNEFEKVKKSLYDYNRRERKNTDGIIYERQEESCAYSEPPAGGGFNSKYTEYLERICKLL